MKFQYSLQSVLDYRKKIEDSKVEAFMKANNKLLDENKALDTIQDHYEKIMHELKEKDNFHIQEQKNYMNYIMNLQQKMERQKIRVSDCERRHNMARTELENAQKERKIMESLEEKEMNRFIQDVKCKEEKELNEIANIGFVRRQKEKHY